ncbi:MAG TPA: MFS transporter [Blastocatellia bacterium]|nr:MFS transporter [Blastocatellia bacterium]HMV84194.1 MFS transporter [Blastocatellia bacterium]HMX25812.1 MFS transporter [Blastocatellia bacterium]HMY75773.1 MFS transporter [Blastocatellia bacterium]HMZ18243.1 MFS transporter [Blastocatellia bacterium]
MSALEQERSESFRPLPPREDDYPSRGYAWYVVGVLTFVYVFSFIDRQILNLLVRPIRRDLGITDTQMSLLMGFSFAIFYTLFGLPLGRLADSKSRRTIIAVGFAFWSLFTTACGLARNFFQMLLMRMGVGVGEAALSPAAYSLITDYFPPKRRATAISVYSMGIYIGSGLAFIIGGTVAGFASKQELWDLPILGAMRPWQVVFFIVGAPGVLLALLMYTVREPLRRDARRIKTAAGNSVVAEVPFSEVRDYLRLNWRTFLCHNVGFALLSFSSYGSSAWVPTFFVRNHGWTESYAGQVYGWVVAIFGTLGIVAGGRFADWMAERGHRDSTMRTGLIVSIAWMPFGMLYPMVSDPYVAVGLLIPAAFMTSAPFGVAPAAIQQIMPSAMRGQASAIYLFVINLIGLGLGPTAVAMTTEYVFRYDQAVNYSLLVVGTTAHVVATVLLWAGLKPFLASLERLKTWTASHG